MQTKIKPRRYPTTPDLEAIRHAIRTVAKISGFRSVDFLGKTVAQEKIAHARTAAIYAVEQLRPALSIDQIGEIFHRHYTSIDYTLRRHTLLLATKPAYQDLIARVLQALPQCRDCGSGIDYGICPQCKEAHGYPIPLPATLP